MSFYRCSRCNWVPEPDETLLDHADATGHPVCTACPDGRPRSLPPDRKRVCRDCQDRAAQHLDEILTMWTELPDALERAANAPLPGGDALALLGPGSRGVQGGSVGDRDARLEADDNRMADVPSVAFTLTSWEDDWRTVRGEPAADLPADASWRVVTAAQTYLTEHATWAAQEHWSWQEYAADLAHLHKLLRQATGRLRAPRRLNVDCFACGDKLVFRVVPDTCDQPVPDPQWWLLDGVAGPVDRDTWTARVTLTRAGLEEPDATCRGCGLRYTKEALALAQRQTMEDLQWRNDDRGTWGRVKAVAEYVDRSHWSLRTWWRQQLVRGTHFDGDLYLHLQDVQAEAALRAPRRPRVDRSA